MLNDVFSGDSSICHKEVYGRVEAATNTFDSLALDLVTEKTGRASLASFSYKGTTLWNWTTLRTLFLPASGQPSG